MARRPIKDKQYARLRKAINRRPLPAYVDLVWWLRSRRHADTTGQAIRLLLEGKVKLESHVVGRERVSRIVAGQTVEQWEPVTRIPGHLRDLNQRLQVIT
jgi:hypothetical protein